MWSFSTNLSSSLIAGPTEGQRHTYFCLFLAIQLSCHLIHSINFFDFFFTVVLMLFISRAKKTYIPKQWRGWLYGGKNQNTKKSLDQKFPSPQKKIPYRTTRPKYASTTTNLYLYQAAQDNTCPIFLLQKLPESKISNPKNPSIIAVTWNPEYLHFVFVQPQIS